MLCSLGASWALVPMEMVNAQTTKTAKINFFMKVSFCERTAGDGITTRFRAIHKFGKLCASTGFGVRRQACRVFRFAARQLGLAPGGQGLRWASGCVMMNTVQHVRKEQDPYVPSIEEFV